MATSMQPGTSPGTADGQDKTAERAFYDRLFSTRRRFDQFQDEIYRDIAREAKRFAPGDRALDLGCGSGTQAVCLMDEGFRVIAADLSIEATRVARGTAERATRTLPAVNADAERLPFADASLDACVCGLLLHHFRDISSVAAELHRVVKPQGVVLALDANGHNPPTRLFLNGLHRVWPRKQLTPNQRAIRMREVREVFSAHGFTDFEFRSITSALRKDWLGESFAAKANYYTRAVLLALSNAVLPQVAQGNMLLSRFRRTAS